MRSILPGVIKAPPPDCFEVPSDWRTSTADGVCTTDLRVPLHAAVGQGKYLGTNPGVVGAWQAMSHVQFQGAITRFVAGAFLEKTFVAGGFGFYSATLRIASERRSWKAMLLQAARRPGPARKEGNS